jgi:hypothetical protein
MPATVWMQATAVTQATTVTSATSNTKNDSNIMTAHNSRNESHSRNVSNNRTANTVSTHSKAGMLAKTVKSATAWREANSSRGNRLTHNSTSISRDANSMIWVPITHEFSGNLVRYSYSCYLVRLLSEYRNSIGSAHLWLLASLLILVSLFELVSFHTELYNEKY